MLEPDSRVLLTEAFRPPVGFHLDYAVVATYSLDLTALLSSLLHLSLVGGELDSEQLNLIAVLEALRRTSGCVRVFHQLGNILGPQQQYPLYSMLEPVLVPVTAPGGGVFHPKLWALRFADGKSTALRVVVLSRNLTGDRSWDVALVMEEGKDGIKAAKPGLAELVDWLAQSCPSAEDRRRTAELAAQLRSARWMLPDGFEEVSFFCHGIGKTAWRMARSDKLLVVSPFLAESAVRALADSTSRAETLVSTPKALSAISLDTLRRFRRVCVLREAAETEDGEDTIDTTESSSGLHAKLYVAEEGRYTRLVIGSANATARGVADHGNVELLTQLVCRASGKGIIADILAEHCMGSVLLDYEFPDSQPQPDEKEMRAELDLEAARRELANVGMVLHCIADGASWRPELRSPSPLSLAGIGSVAIWPVTGVEAQCVDGFGLKTGKSILLPPCGTAALTGLVAFKLKVLDVVRPITMVLNVPVEGMPEGRDKAIRREVIANAEGFLRYLSLLLAELREDGAPAVPPDGHDKSGHRGSWGSGSGPLLEEMTRALVRAPGKLDVIERLVADFRSDEESRKLLPDGFETMWESFATILERTRK